VRHVTDGDSALFVIDVRTSNRCTEDASLQRREFGDVSMALDLRVINASEINGRICHEKTFTGDRVHRVARRDLRIRGVRDRRRGAAPRERAIDTDRGTIATVATVTAIPTAA
jgi:hypothetical protein